MDGAIFCIILPFSSRELVDRARGQVSLSCVAGGMYSPPYSARATPLRGSPLHSGLADPTGLSQLW
jgi:hypothetical protein